MCGGLASTPSQSSSAISTTRSPTLLRINDATPAEIASLMTGQRVELNSNRPLEDKHARGSAKGHSGDDNARRSVNLYAALHFRREDDEALTGTNRGGTAHGHWAVGPAFGYSLRRGYLQNLGTVLLLTRSEATPVNYLPCPIKGVAFCIRGIIFPRLRHPDAFLICG